jgi:putative nucleotidyltransferase with HDIG domain
MSQKRPLSNPARVYIGVVIAAGLAVTGHSVFQLYAHPVSLQWTILAALTLLTGSFTVRVPSLAARISVSEAFVFASVLLFGPAVATVIVALDSFVISLWMQPDSRSPVRSLFNLTAVALAIWTASHVFLLFAGGLPASRSDFGLQHLFWPLFALASSYFLINSWLVAFAVACERRVNAAILWRQNFPWLSLNYFGGASVAALLVSYTRSIDFSALAIILPLLVISYLTHRTSLGRVEDAERHVEQVNTLYMSAIETLAMAVDAKDQITHGHIRRVQVFATELAKRLGVKDERNLRAIEAAALLHDMGKLAIPEHILNKPGKLTVAEFENMKRHADIGADLLSSIRFPYPVVPIVRHHHESWDGTGYPTGIAGTDIPLGARILSVVDCFDALTSDRPYRPRLSTDDAFRIIKERSGRMYDPLVVETFIRAHPEIAQAAAVAGQQARSLVPASETEENSATRPLNEISTGAATAALVIEAGRAVNQSHSVKDALEAAAQYIRQLTPATVMALFRYIPQSDLLVCIHATEDPDGLLSNFTVRNGERITGWSAANAHTICNSDASLDLGKVCESFRPRLQSALSTPLIVRGQTIGVMTAYSPLRESFSDEHKYAVEQIALFLADRCASEFAKASPVVRLVDANWKRAPQSTL